MKKRIWIPVLFLSVTLLGIAIPAVLLHFCFSSQLNVPSKVDDSIYSAAGSSISQNVSEKLSEYERIKLISGVWDSTRKEVPMENVALSGPDAAELARNEIDLLYNAGIYPFQLSTAYDNWYSWDVHCYACVDNTFHTYTANCYKVTFYRYDSDEMHEALITENGTLLALRNNLSAKTMQEVKESLFQHVCNYFDNRYADASIVNLIENPSLKMPVAYPDLTLYERKIALSATLVLNDDSISTKADLTQVNTSALAENAELFDVYFCSNDEYFLYSIFPYK